MSKNLKRYPYFTPLSFATFAIVFIALSFTPIGVASARPLQPADDRDQAIALWEAAIAAKGGRDRLQQIKSMVMSYEETTRNVLGIVVHRGHVERLFVFPDRSWGWDDGLPPPFHLTLGMLNIQRNLRCTVYQNAEGGSGAPVCAPFQPGVAAGDGIKQVQYIYLMETEWVKPQPLNVTKDWIGMRRVDVVHTSFEDKRIDYYLDRKTHLAARVVVYYGLSQRPAQTRNFQHYGNVDGLQMPWQKRVNFHFNVDYDEAIFTHAPAMADGPHAWRKAQN